LYRSERTVTEKQPITILCVASYFKGNRFLERAKRDGCTVVLLTVESALGEPWARECIDELFALPSFADRQVVLNTVSFLARTRLFARVAPLDDFDVDLVALLREHLRVPGMGDTTARYFRDKLAMRARAHDRGIPIPPYVHVLNDQRVRDFMRDVPGPWMLKPRGGASAVGIVKIESAEALWPLLEQLGDKRSNYLLEQMIPGDVYHVDGIVWDQRLVFVEAHKYRRPIIEVTTSGGIFATATCDRASTEWTELTALTQQIIEQFGLVRGVTHTEIIRGRADGKLYFLESAARVGGAHISDLIEASTGVNLWEEWARIEISQGDMPYAAPVARKDYAGLIVSLSRFERSDTSQFNEPEVVWRLNDEKFHVGLVVKSPDHARVEALLENYIPRVLRDYGATVPPITV
jgi:hypothetical protein